MLLKDIRTTYIRPELDVVDEVMVSEEPGGEGLDMFSGLLTHHSH